MKHVFLPENTDELVMRMQIRASHIYIPFVAALNVMAVGVLKADHASKLHRVLEVIFGSNIDRQCGICFCLFWHEHTGDLMIEDLPSGWVKSLLVGMGAYGSVQNI